MSLPLLVVAITATTLLWRLAGLSLKAVRLSSFWAHFLRFMPISIFAALVVSALYKETEHLGVQIIALIVAGVLAWKARQFGLSVVCGLLMWLALTWLGTT